MIDNCIIVLKFLIGGNILKKTIIISILLFVGITVLDYFNLPTLLGMNISNINWAFYMGFLNVLAIIVMYIITYKLLDKRAINKEKNKNDISILLIKNCYEECYSYIEILNEVNVEKYIVPKIDFNSTTPKQIVNLQNAPFDNESIIMDLVKDGQITNQQIKGYFNVKQKFRQYVNMRMITFDAPNIYEPLKKQLLHLLNTELQFIKHLMQE